MDAAMFDGIQPSLGLRIRPPIIVFVWFYFCFFFQLDCTGQNILIEKYRIWSICWAS